MKNINISIFIFFIILLILFTSCKAFFGCIKPLCVSTMNINQKKIYHCKQCQPFEYRDNHMYMETYVNGVLDTVLFDTGCNVLIIISNEKKLTHQRIRLNMPVYTLNQKLMYRIGINTYAIDNNLVSCKNALGATILSSFLSYPCKEDIVAFSHKILGFDLLPGNEQVLYINFSNHTLCVDSVADTTGYVRLESYFSRNSKLYIALTVDSLKYSFYFDTGNQGCLRFTKQQYAAHAKSNDVFFEGLTSYGLDGMIFNNDTSIQQNYVNVFYADTCSLIAQKLYYFDTVGENNVGLGFISHFDWIIDAKNKAVYAKVLPISDKPKEIKYPMYMTAVLNDTLMISVRNLNLSPQLPLFKRIVSVDGVAVTPENCCYYKNLLNSNPNWNEFNIVIEE